MSVRGVEFGVLSLGFRFRLQGLESRGATGVYTVVLAT